MGGLARIFFFPSQHPILESTGLFALFEGGINEDAAGEKKSRLRTSKVRYNIFYKAAKTKYSAAVYCRMEHGSVYRNLVVMRRTGQTTRGDTTLGLIEQDGWIPQ